MQDDREDVTALLEAWAAGDRAARDQLTQVLYKELRALAGHFMHGERAGHTLQPTALVHEALMRLFQQREVPARGRGQFVALISQMMRRVLVDHARKRSSGRRGDGATHVALDDDVAKGDDSPLNILDLERALDRLAELDARQAQVMEMRVFGGFEIQEIAEGLGISPATVKRDWRTGRAWLRRALARDT